MTKARPLYRLIAGKQHGPYSAEALRPLVKDGRISQLDRFSYDGVDWQCAAQFPELVGPDRQPVKSVATPSATVATPNNDVALPAIPDALFSDDGFSFATLLPSDPVAQRSISQDSEKILERWRIGAGILALAIVTFVLLMPQIKYKPRKPPHAAAEKAADDQAADDQAADDHAAADQAAADQAADDHAADDHAAADQAAADQAAADQAAADQAAADKAAADKAAADKAPDDKGADDKVAEPKTVTNTIGMELIELPAGTFTMGSPAGEKNQRTNEEQVAVTLTKPFWLGKTEVTQGQWKQVMGTEPWKGQQYIERGENIPATHFRLSDHFRLGDTIDFCNKLTELERQAGILNANEQYRLPTEAEWEYACRAGTTTAYSFGDDASQLSKYGWFSGNAYNDGEKYAHKVGLKKPNPWGLCDMHGNVAELCSDWYDDKLPGGTDPVGFGGGSNPVIRGGSWWSILVDCRSASRNLIVPSPRHLGFRVARSQ